MTLDAQVTMVLKTLDKHGVQALLMGGQACIFYGGAQFSKDIDLAILAHAGNLLSLSSAMKEIEAEIVAVPRSLDGRLLEKGHAVRFRSNHPDLCGLRIDVMSSMRGVIPFPELWTRRTTIEDTVAATIYNLISLPDLVKAKKTQRAKDWPMISALVIADFTQARPDDVPPNRIRFWLREGLDASFLIDCARRYPIIAEEVAAERPAVRAALKGDWQHTNVAIINEIEAQKAADRLYWAPLKKELEIMRRERNDVA